MTKPVVGLNRYDPKAKRQLAFARFQWVLGGTLARSAQPNYVGPKDADHTVRPFDVTFLQLNKIVCVISANSCDMNPKGRALLKAAGIDFYHAKVTDHAAPTPEQLQEVANRIEGYRTRKDNPGATLVYCGYGQGRTGTYVAGWAMLKHMENRLDKKGMCTLSFLWSQFGVEKQAQVQVIKAVATGRRLSQVSMPGNAIFASVSDGGFKPDVPGNASAPSLPGNAAFPDFGSHSSGPFKPAFLS